MVRFMRRRCQVRRRPVGHRHRRPRTLQLDLIESRPRRIEEREPGALEGRRADHVTRLLDRGCELRADVSGDRFRPIPTTHPTRVDLPQPDPRARSSRSTDDSTPRDLPLIASGHAALTILSRHDNQEPTAMGDRGIHRRRSMCRRRSCFRHRHVGHLGGGLRRRGLVAVPA